MKIIKSADAARKKCERELLRQIRKHYRDWQTRIYCGRNYFPENIDGCGAEFGVGVDDLKSRFPFEPLFVMCPCCDREITMMFVPEMVDTYIRHCSKPPEGINGRKK